MDSCALSVYGQNHPMVHELVWENGVHAPQRACSGLLHDVLILTDLHTVSTWCINTYASSTLKTVLIGQA